MGTRMPGFCLNRIRPQARVRSPQLQAEKEEDLKKNEENTAAAEDSCGVEGGEQKPESATTEGPVKSVGGRRIVIVVDGSAEAKRAIQWALTHTAQPQDTLVLLHVIKPGDSRIGGGCEKCSKETAPKAYKVVETLMNLCHLKRPEVKAEVAVVRGKDKGPVIVKEAAELGAGLLVLGQKKRSTTMAWRLLTMWAARNGSGRTSGCGGVVEYCIQNAHCMAVAVRRKSKKLGGYLITTKRQKDFWLLA